MFILLIIIASLLFIHIVVTVIEFTSLSWGINKEFFELSTQLDENMKEWEKIMDGLDLVQFNKSQETTENTPDSPNKPRSRRERRKARVSISQLRQERLQSRQQRIEEGEKWRAERRKRREEQNQP